MIDVMLCKKIYDLCEINNSNYIYEQKYDGGRVVAEKKDNKVKLYTRDKNIITNSFPEITEVLKQIQRNFIVDGEICIIKNGRCDFSAYQKRALTKNPFQINLLAKTIPATFFIFDILEIDGNDLTFEPLIERKKILSMLLANTKNMLLEEVIYYENPDFLLQKRDLIEGIVAKQKNGIYEKGKRSNCWLKYRFIKEDIIVAIDYEETNSGIVAIDKNGNRITINGRMAEEVRRIIDSIGEVNLEINYMEKTDDGKYRFPAFKRIAKEVKT